MTVFDYDLAEAIWLRDDDPLAPILYPFGRSASIKGIHEPFHSGFYVRRVYFDVARELWYDRDSHKGAGGSTIEDALLWVRQQADPIKAAKVIVSIFSLAERGQGGGCLVRFLRAQGVR